MTVPKEEEDNRSVLMRLTLLIQAVLVVGLGLFLWRGDWQNVVLTVLVIGLTLVPLLLKHNRIILPPDFQFISVLFVFLSFFLGSASNFYEHFWWWDMVLHAGSGFLSGMVGFLVIFLMNQTDRIPKTMKPGFVWLFTVTFAVFIGVLWEIFEYASDHLMPSMNMQSRETGVNDTMHDLIVDLLGAIVVAGIGFAYMKSGKYSFITDSVRGFIKRNPRMFKKKKGA